MGVLFPERKSYYLIPDVLLRLVILGFLLSAFFDDEWRIYTNSTGTTKVGLFPNVLSELCKWEIAVIILFTSTILLNFFSFIMLPLVYRKKDPLVLTSLTFSFLSFGCAFAVIIMILHNLDDWRSVPGFDHGVTSKDYGISFYMLLTATLFLSLYMFPAVLYTMDLIINVFFPEPMYRRLSSESKKAQTNDQSYEPKPLITARQ